MYNNERVYFNVDKKMEGVNVENEKLFGNFFGNLQKFSSLLCVSTLMTTPLKSVDIKPQFVFRP